MEFIGNVGNKVAEGGVWRKRATIEARCRTAEQDAQVVRVSIDELLRTSDIITLHTPLTPETNKLIDSDMLARMKPTAIVINTSRGEIIDERALVAALEDGGIAGAGLDVFEKEPVDPANRLLRLENVVVSPHSAGTTLDTWGRRLDFAFANMRRVSAGEQPLGLVTS